jgi:hypothetical protein
MKRGVCALADGVVRYNMFMHLCLSYQWTPLRIGPACIQYAPSIPFRQSVPLVRYPLYRIASITNTYGIKKNRHMALFWQGGEMTKRDNA